MLTSSDWFDRDASQNLTDLFIVFAVGSLMAATFLGLASNLIFLSILSFLANGQK